MAERRMFTQKIVDSDAFLDMPLSTQCLYFHLNMRADDDGFVNNPKKIQRMIGCSEDDLKLLIVKRFIIGFDSGVIVIKHWRMHNTLRKDRYHPTQYQEELSALKIKDNNAYTEVTTSWQPVGNQLATENSIGKDSIDKNSIVYIPESPSEDSTNPPSKPEKEKETKRKYGEYQHVLLTDKQYENLIAEYPNYLELIKFLDEYIEMKGYKAKNHYLAIRKWVVDAVKENDRKHGKGQKHMYPDGFAF